MFVRMMAVEAIEDAGYATVEAEDAERAISLLDERGDIAVVFTDIRMPGRIDGLALARRVRTCWPGMPLIVTSGHALGQDRDIPSAARFLQKPYRAAALVGELDRLLGRG